MKIGYVPASTLDPAHGLRARDYLEEHGNAVIVLNDTRGKYTLRLELRVRAEHFVLKVPLTFRAFRQLLRGEAVTTSFTRRNPKEKTD